MINKMRILFRSIGPGFIIASVVLGPGSIAVASRIGSAHGYKLLWVIAIAAICMATYTIMSARFGVGNDKSILQTITDTYGRWFSALIGISAFLSAASFQFGNNLGIATGMHGLTGISETIWPLLFTTLAIVFIFWAKNVYKILEKMMMIMVLVMIIAFFINLVFVKPNLIAILKGFLPVSFSVDQFDEMAAIVGTTFVLNACIYHAYLVYDKGWKEDDLKIGMRDTLMGITVLGIISTLIIVTSAAALHPKGIIVATAADMSIQLEALFGNFSKYIFNVGLCAAAFSSLVINAVIGGGLLSDGFGFGRSMQDKMPKIFTTLILLIGMIITVFFRGDIVYALVLAQGSTLFAVPSIGIGLLLVANNKAIMRELKNNRTQNIIAATGFILILIMVVYMYHRLITFLGNI